MSETYANARDVLPPALLRKVQRHWQGMLWVPRAPKRRLRLERDRLLLMRYRRGGTIATLAREFGLSRERVRQICKAGIAFPLPPPDPLLRPCGTEILEFGLLIAAGAWKLRESKEASGRFVLLALALVGALFVLCPEDSAFQRGLDRLAIGAVASLLEHPLRLFGIPVRAEGPALGEMVVVRGCFGPSYLAILALCAFAFPGRRIASAFVVAPGMILPNAVRIEAL